MRRQVTRASRTRGDGRELNLHPEDLELLIGMVRLPPASVTAWLRARMEERGYAATPDDVGNAIGVTGDGPRDVILHATLGTRAAAAAYVAAATVPVTGVRVKVIVAREMAAWAPPPGAWSIIGVASTWNHVAAPDEREGAAHAIARAIADIGGTPVLELRAGLVTYGVGDGRFETTPFEDSALEEYAAAIAVLRDVLKRAAAA